MTIQALIRKADNVCVNVIVVGPDYIVPDDLELQSSEGAAIGSIWNGVGYDPKPQSTIDVELNAAVQSLPPFFLKMIADFEARITALEGRGRPTDDDMNNLMRGWMRHDSE